jgi:hypothetical protein
MISSGAACCSASLRKHWRQRCLQLLLLCAPFESRKDDLHFAVAQTRRDCAARPRARALLQLRMRMRKLALCASPR